MISASIGHEGAISGSAPPRIGRARRTLLFALTGFGKDGVALFDMLGLSAALFGAWLEKAGAPDISARGPVFDASSLMVQAALLGEGVALAPPSMFRRELNTGSLVQPFPLSVDGPAIVEAPETTIVIPPGCTAVVDEYLNVRISVPTRNGRRN